MNLSVEVVAGAIGASALVSITSLSGLFALWIEPERLNRIIPYLVALAVGVLLGDAFIHLIPDAVKRQGSISTVCLAALLGMFLFFVLEKLVRWRHDHPINMPSQQDDIRPMAKMNLMGDAVHNFVDGILIGGSFLVDPMLGFTTTLAIIAHEIPQEIGDVGALVYGGYSPAKAVLYNFYCSLTVVAGAVFALFFSQIAESSLIFLLPEYSTLPNLIGQTAIFGLGIGLMQSIIILEQSLLSQ